MTTSKLIAAEQDVVWAVYAAAEGVPDATAPRAWDRRVCAVAVPGRR